MNLRPIIDWSKAVIKMLKGREPLKEEGKKLSFVLEFEELINELSEVLKIVINIQEVLKTKGLSN